MLVQTSQRGDGDRDTDDGAASARPVGGGEHLVDEHVGADGVEGAASGGFALARVVRVCMIRTASMVDRRAKRLDMPSSSWVTHTPRRACSARARSAAWSGSMRAMNRFSLARSCDPVWVAAIVGELVVQLDEGHVVIGELVGCSADQADPVGVDLAGSECAPGLGQPVTDDPGLRQPVVDRRHRLHQGQAELVTDRRLGQSPVIRVRPDGRPEQSRTSSNSSSSVGSQRLIAGDLDARDRATSLEDHLTGIDNCFHTSNLEVATDSQFEESALVDPPESAAASTPKV